MKFNYYYGNEAEQFTFVRIPKVMLTDKTFSDLSCQAKMLYGVLLDRMGLSMRNGWLDEENRVFIIYQIAEIQEDLGFSRKKSIDYLAELEQFGLVEKKRRGLGLSNILYVKSFMATGDTEQGISRSVEMGTSRSSETALQEVPKSTSLEVPESAPLRNNNKLNNTECNNIKSNLIISPVGTTAPVDKSMRCDGDEMAAYSEIIKENIDYDALLERYPLEREMIQGIFDLILETVLTKGDTILISSNAYPTQLVKSKFLKLDYGHIEYVMGCFQKNTTKVQNIKKYLLASLFNAPSTIDGYYRAEVNHDFPQYAAAR